MSFSSDIKNELCKVEFKRECCLRAECYGAWLFSRCFTLKESAFVTENSAVARRMLELAAAGAGISGELSFGVSRRKRPAYRVSLPEPGSRQALLEEFGHTGKEASLRINRANLENECCTAAFLRGAFLACGYRHRPGQGVPPGVRRGPQEPGQRPVHPAGGGGFLFPVPGGDGAQRELCGLPEGERPHRGPCSPTWGPRGPPWSSCR